MPDRSVIVGGGGMVSNHRLVLFTHALCRLSYRAPLVRSFAPDLRLICFAIRRSARTDYCGHCHRRLRFQRIRLGLIFARQQNQPVRRLFGRNQRQLKADFGLSTEIFGTRHPAQIPRALPATLNRSSGSRPTVQFVTFLARLWTPRRGLGVRAGGAALPKVRADNALGCPAFNHNRFQSEGSGKRESSSGGAHSPRATGFLRGWKRWSITTPASSGFPESMSLS